MDVTQESVENFLENKDDIDYLIEVIANRVLFGKRTGNVFDWPVEKIHWSGDTLRVDLKYHYHWKDCADYESVEFPVDLIWKENGFDEALDLGNKRIDEKNIKEEERIFQEKEKEKERRRMRDFEEYERLKKQFEPSEKKGETENEDT